MLRSLPQQDMHWCAPVELTGVARRSSLAGMLVHGFARDLVNWVLVACHQYVIDIGVEGLRRRIRGLH